MSKSRACALYSKKVEAVVSWDAPEDRQTCGRAGLAFEVPWQVDTLWLRAEADVQMGRWWGYGRSVQVIDSLNNPMHVS